ncbi:hypothetical protein ACFL0E_01155 [Nanoarchaeota archaeon]
MPTLIACLSTGKGTWTEVTKIIKSQEWNKIFLITHEFGKENFKPNEKTELILINSFNEIDEISEEIKKQLKDKINDFEIALNVVSGIGKEHMAILKAVMELGLNFRLVTIKNDKLEIL